MKWWEVAIIAIAAAFLGYLAGQAKQVRVTQAYRARLHSLASMSARHWHVFHPEHDDVHWELSRLAVEAAPE